MKKIIDKILIGVIVSSLLITGINAEDYIFEDDEDYIFEVEEDYIFEDTRGGMESPDSIFYIEEENRPTREEVMLSKYTSVPIEMQPGYIYDTGGSYVWAGITVSKEDFTDYVQIGENLMLAYDIGMGTILVVTIVVGGAALGPAGIALAAIAAKKIVTKMIIKGSKTIAKEVTSEGMSRNLDKIVTQSKALANKARSDTGRKSLAKSVKRGSKKVGKGLYDLAMPVKVPTTSYRFAKNRPSATVPYTRKGYPKFDAKAEINLGYTNASLDDLMNMLYSKHGHLNKKEYLKKVKNELRHEHNKIFNEIIKNRLTKGHSNYDPEFVRKLGPRKAKLLRNGEFNKAGFRRHHHEDDPNRMQLIGTRDHTSSIHYGGIDTQWMPKIFSQI